MKKLAKKLAVMLTAMAIVAASLAIDATPVAAAGKAEVPKKVHASYTFNTTTTRGLVEEWKEDKDGINGGYYTNVTLSSYDKDGNFNQALYDAYEANSKANRLYDRIENYEVVNASSWTVGAIPVKFATAGDSVKAKSIKTSDPNLKARVIYTWDTVTTGTTDGKYDDAFHMAKIGLYANPALEEGKYTVDFTVVNGKKKVSSHKVTVYYSKELPWKSVKFGNKFLVTDNENAATLPQATSGEYISNAKSGKFSVKMNKGYKLEKIVVRYPYAATKTETVDDSNDYATDIATTTVTLSAYNKDDNFGIKKTTKKSSVKVTLNKTPYTYVYTSTYTGKGDNKYSFTSSSKRKDMTADTYVTIYYIDKYTKEHEANTFTISRYINKF